MIDDIISYGGTFYYSANKLKEEGFGKIYAYSTHTENEMLNEEKGTFIKSLNDGTVERLFTTNSIFNKEHNKIETIKIWMS
jgi:ribose-phosphate pyrophosphokinase